MPSFTGTKSCSEVTNLSSFCFSFSAPTWVRWVGYGCCSLVQQYFWYRCWPVLRLTAPQCFPMIHLWGLWGDTCSPPGHQDLANARVGIYSCVLVVTLLVVEDSDLFFDTAFNHPNKKTLPILLLFVFNQNIKEIQLPMQICCYSWRKKKGTKESWRKMSACSLILDHFKAALNPLPLESHDFSVG